MFRCCSYSSDQSGKLRKRCAGVGSPCWLLGRPYVFVDEFYKVATPFMVNAERAAVEAGVLRPAGGHEYWLRVFPWLLIAELTALAETGNIAEHEEHFARASLRLLGVDDTLAPGLIARSRELVAESGIPEPKSRGAKRARGSTSRCPSLSTRTLRTPSPSKKPTTRPRRSRRCSRICKARGRWIGSSAATSASARRRWPCAPPSSPCRRAARLPC